MSIQKLNSDNFKTTISSSNKLVIVDFYADWCGPCKMIAPILEEISEENDDVEVYKINVDEDPEIAKEFSVRSIPTIVSFKEGQEHKKAIGAQPKDALLDLLR